MPCENGNAHHDGTGDDFGCKLQTIRFDPYAMPSRLNLKAAPKREPDSYARGIPTDSRGMPFLRKDGTPMGQREFDASRSKIEQHRRKLRNDPNPLSLKGA